MAVDSILARRDRIGPIGLSTSDLIREIRDEADDVAEMTDHGSLQEEASMRSSLAEIDDIAPPQIDVPPSVPPTPEEIARRRAHFARTMAHREAIGPIDIPADELVHAARQDLGDDGE